MINLFYKKRNRKLAAAVILVYGLTGNVAMAGAATEKPDDVQVLDTVVQNHEPIYCEQQEIDNKSIGIFGIDELDQDKIQMIYQTLKQNNEKYLYCFRFDSIETDDRKSEMFSDFVTIIMEAEGSSSIEGIYGCFTRTDGKTSEIERITTTPNQYGEYYESAQGSIILHIRRTGVYTVYHDDRQTDGNSYIKLLESIYGSSEEPCPTQTPSPTNPWYSEMPGPTETTGSSAQDIINIIFGADDNKDSEAAKSNTEIQIDTGIITYQDAPALTKTGSNTAASGSVEPAETDLFMKSNNPKTSDQNVKSLWVWLILEIAVLGIAGFCWRDVHKKAHC